MAVVSKAMDVFLIHRFESRREAIRLVKDIAAKGRIDVHPVVLNSSSGEEWKHAASSRISECEAVAIYDLAACMQSDNAAWEIERARASNKPIVVLDPRKVDDSELSKLYGLYHDEEEFNSYFHDNASDNATLYKIMVDSSEQLIQRRQRMNAFFITAIGALMTIAGALAKFGTIKSPTLSFVVMTTFGLVGLLLCNSWRNLIDNYGKLNAAKFRVISKLEQSLSARIFSAEWTALGKGRRPRKYQSFTSTENLVPLYFAILIMSLVLFAALWHIDAS